MRELFNPREKVTDLRADGYGQGRRQHPNSYTAAERGPGPVHGPALRHPGLPRKEVIQPHVPVRLPCYDFVPVTSLTLGACLACALAQRLQVLPASMT